MDVAPRIAFVVSLVAFSCAIAIPTAFICAQDKPQKQAQQPTVAKSPVTAGGGANAITTPFANETNGFTNQDQFDNDREEFDNIETIVPEEVCNKKEDEKAIGNLPASRQTPPVCESTLTKGGLGPVYNATSCTSCHQNPISGSASQIAEIRAGHIDTVSSGDKTKPPVARFVEPPTGSLVHQRAVNPKIQETIPREETSRTLRMTTNVLGDGFVEVLPDQDILNVQSKQPPGLRGLAVLVPVAVKANGAGKFDFRFRIGRFGWKCQHASLLNFSADAYINEMGITSPLQESENQSNTGVPIEPFDGVPVEQDHHTEDAASDDHKFGGDVEAFTRFMRSTKVPPRDAQGMNTMPVKTGEAIFNDQAQLSVNPKNHDGPIRKLGCAICHQPDFTKPVQDTQITAIDPIVPPQDGSDLSAVPKALGRNKDHPDPKTDTIHPYSDFMLHDIGTGDGIAQTQHAQLEPVGLRGGMLNDLLIRVLRPQNSRANPAEKSAPLLPPELLKFKDGKLLPFPQDLRAFNLEDAEDGALIAVVRVLKAEMPRELDQRTTNMIRTAPLWGVRTRPQLMHDGLSSTFDDAIQRHKVRAKWIEGDKTAEVNLPQNFDDLNQEEKEALRSFLRSL